MMEDFVPFGSRAYFVLLAILAFARGMDFLSTWVATPNLVLEGNPIAKKLGWRGGLIFNIIFCVAVSIWPLPSIMMSTMSLLVAARNFQNAWLMRSMGESPYAIWMHERLTSSHPALFILCIGGQSLLTAIVGAPLMLFAPEQSVVFAIGSGICGYAIAVFFFSVLSMWRIRRA
jgi:hypothetical protein